MAVLPTRKKAPVTTGTASQRTTVQKVNHDTLTWYNFTALSEADLKYLSRQFQFHELDFEDVRSTKQRPKLDEYDDYLFLIFHVPFYDRGQRRLVQEEIDVFIGNGFFVTIHSNRLKMLNELFDDIKRSPINRSEYMGKGSGFLLYELISRLFEHAFPMLDKIAERINDVERHIFSGRSKEMVEELSHLKLEIINFRRIIRPQRVLIATLEGKQTKYLPENLEIYFDDVLDTINRINDLLENYKEVVESLEDTNEAFIQHRTNNVVKVLTILSLITLPSAALSGLLAMNIRYPFSVGQETFFVVVGCSVTLALLLFLYMYWKKWL